MFGLGSSGDATAGSDFAEFGWKRVQARYLGIGTVNFERAIGVISIPCRRTRRSALQRYA
jgi:hypothetical protein